VIGKAFTFAASAHRGQVDKAGRPYITHPVRVANRVMEAGGSHAEIVAALLHDTVDDRSCAFPSIEALARIHR
jgi:guanosine-3',5'-bis(diphosphate) 3'-pyrophosphohydrolase